MHPAISIVTLAVEDADRSIAFYRDGLKLPVLEKPPVTYFALQGTWLAVFPADRLAKFAGMEMGESGTAPRVTLSCNVSSRAEVDLALAEAAAAGGRIETPARAYSWGGYAGWFSDPDGHAWEVVHNPRPFINS